MMVVPCLQQTVCVRVCRRARVRACACACVRATQPQHATQAQALSPPHHRPRATAGQVGAAQRQGAIRLVPADERQPRGLWRPLRYGDSPGRHWCVGGRPLVRSCWLARMARRQRAHSPPLAPGTRPVAANARALSARNQLGAAEPWPGPVICPLPPPRKQAASSPTPARAAAIPLPQTHLSPFLRTRRHHRQHQHVQPQLPARRAAAAVRAHRVRRARRGSHLPLRHGVRGQYGQRQCCHSRRACTDCCDDAALRVQAGIWPPPVPCCPRHGR